jgi:hypothetical protein
MSNGQFPLHVAKRADACRMLLEAARATALAADANGQLPLHIAAWKGNAQACAVLAEAVGVAALMHDSEGHLPLQRALMAVKERGRPWDAARCLLAHGPAALVLSHLRMCGASTNHLFADAIACRPPPHHPPLSEDEWALLPSPCPGLLRALPTALAHSSSQARQLVRRLPAAERRQLHHVLRCLARLQRRHGIAPDVMFQVRGLIF